MRVQPTFSILGSGKYLPTKKVTAQELDTLLEVPSGTSFKKTGVRTRYYMDHETIADMAAKAAQKALIEANIQCNDLDAIIFAATSLEQPIPCTAAIIQNRLGFGKSGIPCFDINATCLSFLTALDTTVSQIAMGRFSKVLIVTAETAHDHLNKSHIESAALFGDGAVAHILSAPQMGSSFKLIASHMETYSDGMGLCEIKGGGNTLPPRKYREEIHDDYCFSMNGPKLFKKTLTHLNPFLERLFKDTGITYTDITVVVPHQASRAALKLIKKRIPITQEKWIDILEEHGNQLAASIPTAFHEVLKSESINQGDYILLIGTGAGIALSAQIIQYMG
ncbi:MAG: hypothetical protein OCC49_19665 [Fibrobacterales bacterium]